jgi:iron complex outermembrane receptor protein
MIIPHRLFFALSTLLLFCINNVQAQQFTLSGSITDSAGTPVQTAAVSLLQSADSAWVQSVLSDDTGAFTFNNIQAGNYLLNVQALGYPKTVKAVTINDHVTGFSVMMAKSNLTLQEVSVTDKRSFIETAPGKVIVNVEQSMSTSGTNVLDLLRKSPGISVSASGDIGMQGKQGVMVLINDKQTYMSGDELAQYLRSLQADQVAQLELITQPSAKYDAEGNAGIINIKTKRNKKRGFNGNVSATYLQGKFPIYDLATRLNYRDEKLNLSLGLSRAYNYGFRTQNLDRTFRNANTYDVTGSLHQHMYLWEKAQAYHGTLNADYALTKKTILGTNLLLNYNPVPYGSTTDAVIYDKATGTRVNNHAEFYADQLRKRATANAFLRHTFAENNELYMSIDYLKYWMVSSPELTNTDKDEAGSGAFPPLILRGELPMNIDVYSTRADYSITAGSFNIETGAKSSYVRTENEAYYELFQNNTWVYDSLRNNHFLYTENINAAYVNMNRALGDKWKMQLGLRAENTNAEGKQSVMNQTFTRHYVSLFPTGYVTYKADSNNQFEVNYGRRIQRPEYRALNPFIKFVSQYNYDMGNPYLQPQFTNNTELRHSYKTKLFTTLNYSHVSNIRQTLLVINDSTKVTYAQPMNAGSSDQAGLSLMYNHTVKDWWELSVSGNVYYNWFDGIVSNRRVKVSGAGYSFNINNQFSFAKTWSAQVMINYEGLSREGILWYTGDWFYTEFNLGKRVLKDKMRISLRIEDPFYLARFRIEGRVNEIDGKAVYAHNTRKVGISISYNFGQSWDRKNNRDNGIGDEAGRIR